jgi:hypothetical protein
VKRRWNLRGETILMAASSLGERFILKGIFGRKRLDVRKRERGVAVMYEEIRRGAALD